MGFVVMKAAADVILVERVSNYAPFIPLTNLIICEVYDLVRDFR